MKEERAEELRGKRQDLVCGRRRRWRGSYTVEASLVVPIVIFAMALAMKLGIALYQEIEEQPEDREWAEMWGVGDFYNHQAIKEVFDDQS